MNQQPTTINVFVYGTLKPGEANYKNYCEGRVNEAIAAYTYGNLYDLAVGYPAMIEGTGKVRGVLLIFNRPDILKNLDQLECYQEHRALELNEYYRQQVPVYSLSDKLLGKAWSYFMTKNQVKKYQGTAIASGWWSGK